MHPPVARSLPVRHRLGTTAVGPCQNVVDFPALVTVLLPFFAGPIVILRGLWHKKFCLRFFEGSAQYRAPTPNRERQLRFGVDPKMKSADLARRKRNKIMKQLNAVLRMTFWMVTMFAMVFLSQAQSGENVSRTTQQKKSAAHEIHIFDQNGRPAVSGVPSGTGQIFDVQWDRAGFCLPRTHSISRSATRCDGPGPSSGHSVTSGPPCAADSQYCSPDDTNCPAGILSNVGTVYDTHLYRARRYSYHLRRRTALSA